MILIGPFIRPHKQICYRERPQLHIFHSYVWQGKCTKRRLKLFFMCEGGTGQFHHGKATNRIGSTLISLSGISLAGLPTFLWVMHRNVGYNNQASKLKKLLSRHLATKW